MINQIISKSTKIKPDEFRAVILSFAFIFSSLVKFSLILNAPLPETLIIAIPDGPFPEDKA